MLKLLTYKVKFRLLRHTKQEKGTAR